MYTNTLCFSLLRLILLSAAVLPLFLEDVNLKMKDWGTEGKINPFNEIYDVSFCTSRVKRIFFSKINK